MNDILHANIFFIITAVAVVVLALFWIVILWYVIGIVREVRAVARRINKASEDIERDFGALRGHVLSGGERIRSLSGAFFDFLIRMLASPRPAPRPRRPKRTTPPEDLVQ